MKHAFRGLRSWGDGGWRGALGMALAVALAAPAADAKARDKRQQVDVIGVLGTEEGQYVVVLRTREEPVRFLPIWIGELEALNIRLRMQRQKPPRPLTLNLLESVLSSGHIEVMEIAIDDMKAGVFLGKITLRHGTRNWRVDARPSDAIGLAVGNGAPIWVSPSVIENAAVDLDDIDLDNEAPSTDGPGAPPAAIGNYEETL